MITGKNLHLLISAVILTIVALAYGLSPHNILPGFFDFKVETVDLKHVFRAIMGLYAAMVVLWVTGIRNPLYWRAATVSNVCFMIGLASGRILSLVFDGIPSFYFLAGLAAEVILALWGIKNLARHRSAPDQ